MTVDHEGGTGEQRPPERLRLSVVVCTHRRPHLFAPFLAVLEDVWDDRDDEMVVVDDARTTDDVERIACTSSLDVRYLDVDGPGLAAARNHGWRAATGDVVVFFDDDSRPAPGALAAYRRAFSTEPDLAVAGGPLLLRWPGGAPPEWYSPPLSSYFSGLDRSARSARATIPFGANMAFRRTVLEAHGGFDEHLGRRGRSLLSGEETELIGRIRDAGGRVGWVRDALVDHEVEPERTQLTWLLRRAVAQGKTDVLLDGPSTGRSRLLASAAAGAVLLGWGDLLRRGDDEPLRPRATRDLIRRARRVGRVIEVVGAPTSTHAREPSG